MYNIFDISSLNNSGKYLFLFDWLEAEKEAKEWPPKASKLFGNMKQSETVAWTKTMALYHLFKEMNTLILCTIIAYI